MESSTDPGDVYESSGLTVSSSILLSAPRLDGTLPAMVDLTIQMSEAKTPPFERLSDNVIAELVVDGQPRYTIYGVDEGYVCRVPSVGDFVIDADLRRVTCHPFVGGRHDVIPIVTTGTVTAFILAMGGRCVLHGSAVERGGNALAFVGTSGQGKSTMAALFCSAGSSLVTDDVLPLEFEFVLGRGESVRCLRSSNEIRLREKAASLADRFDQETNMRITADERFALEPVSTALPRSRLSAVILPRPDRGHSGVSARLLPSGEASFWLNRCQRIEGWKDRDQMRKHFLDVGRVAASVPVYEVSIPWGPPFAQDLAQRVLDGCGLTPSFEI